MSTDVYSSALPLNPHQMSKNLFVFISSKLRPKIQLHVKSGLVQVVARPSADKPLSEPMTGFPNNHRPIMYIYYRCLFIHKYVWILEVPLTDRYSWYRLYFVIADLTPVSICQYTTATTTAIAITTTTTVNWTLEYKIQKIIKMIDFKMSQGNWTGTSGTATKANVVIYTEPDSGDIELVHWQANIITGDNRWAQLSVAPTFKMASIRVRCIRGPVQKVPGNVATPINVRYIGTHNPHIDILLPGENTYWMPRKRPD